MQKYPVLTIKVSTGYLLPYHAMRFVRDVSLAQIRFCLR